MLEMEREQFKAFSQDDVLPHCSGELHPKAEKGLKLFNQKDYWHAHEELELAWMDEISPARNLYKGILQVGVAYLHIQRGNFVGAMKMNKRSKVWLSPWPDRCRTVDVGQLKADFKVVITEVRRLGVENILELDQKLLKPIQRVPANAP